jgi:hypothetical protein
VSFYYLLTVIDFLLLLFLFTESHDIYPTKICDACQLGKQTKSSFKKKKVISTSRPLELLHMDLFGPIRTASLSGKLYAFVIVDDYSRYTWVLFLAHKNEAHKAFVKHCRRIQNEKGYTINNVRSDRGREFDNQDIELYCDQNGFGHNFSAPRTPQTKWRSRT